MLIDINHCFPMISQSPSFFTLERCKDGVRCSNSPSTNDGSNHVQYLILGQQINMPLNMFKNPQSTWIGRDRFFFSLFKSRSNHPFIWVSRFSHVSWLPSGNFNSLLLKMTQSKQWIFPFKNGDFPQLCYFTRGYHLVI